MCKQTLKKREISRRKKGMLNLDLIEVGLEATVSHQKCGPKRNQHESNKAKCGDNECGRGSAQKKNEIIVDDQENDEDLDEEGEADDDEYDEEEEEDEEEDEDENVHQDS